MGFPSEGSEGLYRNSMKDVQRFMEQKHKGKFMIYNLCSERVYEPAKFSGAVVRFPFDDHDPPPLHIIDKFADHSLAWLAKDPANVVVVHCKAGKGRTGTMIACLMLKAGWVATADEGLEIFGRARTANSKGVTIPSQIRYVGYYEQILAARKSNRPPACLYPDCVKLPVEKILLHTVPNFDTGGGCDPYAVIEVGGKKVFKSEPRYGMKQEKVVEIDCGGVMVSGDVRVQLMDKDTLTDDKMAHFWFHTCLIEGRRLLLPKLHVDKAIKDKACEHFDEKFCVEVIFGRPPEDKGVWDDWEVFRPEVAQRGAPPTKSPIFA
jgi:phosphatidylinositol-3,4,5-trisphosphate 3-phosphatase/dual-specificity protein phosphatase PTEN